MINTQDKLRSLLKQYNTLIAKKINKATRVQILTRLYNKLSPTHSQIPTIVGIYEEITKKLSFTKKTFF